MGKLSEKSMRDLYLKGVIPIETYCAFKIQKKKRNLRPEYKRAPFNFNKFTDDESLLYFRFNRKDMMTLLSHLRVPAKFVAYPEIPFTGIEGLCVLFRRLSYPNRLNDLVPMFNRDPTTLSRIINHMINWMHTNYSKFVKQLAQDYLSREELEALAESVSLMGCPYPNIVGFIDGTFRGSCRPTYNQRDFYSGYKKGHGLKYQSITFPNGLIGRLDGGFIARRHDSAIVNLSGVVDEMKDFFTNPDGSSYAVYGDVGYTNSKFIKVGFKNRARMSQQQKDFNSLMSSLRVTVEYGFKGVIQQWAFLDFRKNQKIYLQPVQKMYDLGAFLYNCQCCLKGRNQLSDVFECSTPTLAQYLRYP